MTQRAMRLFVLLVALGLFAGACQSTTIVSDQSEPSVSTPGSGSPEPGTDAGSRASATEPQAEADSAPSSEPVDSEPSPATQPSPGPDPESAPVADLPDEIRTAVDTIASRYTTATDAWEGFVPNDYPVVLALKDHNDILTGALAINHPAADQLGTATAIEIAGTPFASLHLIVDPIEGVSLQALQSFDFALILGGVSSFAMVAGGRQEFFTPTSERYVSTLLHEMFHLYQRDVFVERGADQDIDGYDYSPENLALIGLEQRALSAAVDAETSRERERAARHFLAIRYTRLEADSRIELDGRQEIREGTARYVEHLLAGSDTNFPYHLTNFADQLIVDIPSTNIKANMAFGRWYATGAATLHLLTQLEAESVSAQVDGGAPPFEVLAEVLGNEQSEHDGLVEEAIETYDPTNELPRQARIASEAVLSEPNFWGDSATGSDGGDVQDAEPVRLTQGEFECLVERGVVFSAEVLEISDADWTACYNQP